MIYRAYIDDSADRRREQIIVAGAIMGQNEKWDALNRAWKARLKEDEIGYFKSSHCETLNGEFWKFRALGMEEGKRKAYQIRDDLYRIIADCMLIGVGVTLSVSTHAMMLADQKKYGPIPAVPYRLAFQQVIAECGKAMQLLGRGNIAAFGHDDGNDFDALSEIYKRFKESNPRYRGTLASFVAVDDKTHPEVQAADVVAFVTYDHAKAYRSEPTRGNLQRLRHSVYKIVNWLDDPRVSTDLDSEEAPARADYVS